MSHLTRVAKTRPSKVKHKSDFRSLNCRAASSSKDKHLPRTRYEQPLLALRVNNIINKASCDWLDKSRIICRPLLKELASSFGFGVCKARNTPEHPGTLPEHPGLEHPQVQPGTPLNTKVVVSVQTAHVLTDPRTSED